MIFCRKFLSTKNQIASVLGNTIYAISKKSFWLLLCDNSITVQIKNTMPESFFKNKPSVIQCITEGCAEFAIFLTIGLPI
ncbi:MAG TPA: hypothetical protein DHW64_13805 [Chitinophagaceae bacterium]|nr:hypothetical protein [Chitinophagaceae bacterium]